MNEFDRLEKIVETPYWEPNDVKKILELESYIATGLLQMDRILDEDDFTTNAFQKVSQAESQKIAYIDKVIRTLDRHENLNTSEIIEESGLSRGSVIRTLDLLREKKIVWLKTKHDRQNNEKIYSLRRFRAMLYMKNLLWWKNARESEKKLEFEKKIDIETEKLLPKNFETREVFFYGRKVAIKDLPTSFRRGIRQAFTRGFYCIPCFNLGHVSLLVKTPDESNICPRCGQETPFEEEKRMTPRLYKRIKKSKKTKWAEINF